MTNQEVKNELIEYLTKRLEYYKDLLKPKGIGEYEFPDTKAYLYACFLIRSIITILEE